MFNFIKKIKRVLLDKDFYCKSTVSLDSCTRIGSKYGGWWLAEEFVKNKDNGVLLSFGLGEDITFDLGMIKEYGFKVYGFDPTPRSVNYIESLNLDRRFTLNEFAISDKNEQMIFNLPENNEHISGSLEGISSTHSVNVDCKDIKTILGEINADDIDIIKMDIEGSEYKVIDNMMKEGIYPKQLLVEFHHFFESFSAAHTKKSIRLLLDNGYELFYIEGYNYSFVRLNNG